MKVLVKSLLGSCAAAGAAFVLLAGPSAHAAEAVGTPVKVQVNDELLQFPEVQPFIDEEGILQVPLRVLSEKLGYQIGWERKENGVKVTLVNKDQAIQLTTDQGKAIVNSKWISLESAPKLVEGNTYVPLRFITETFGSPIEWSGGNDLAIVAADGKSHKPAYIAPPPPPKPAVVAAKAAPAPSLPEQIIQAASGYQGTPYRWGGTTPSGFDCSGFVRYLFLAKGIDLPRTSVGMYDSAGTRVTDLQAGDLVFFASKQVDHVGIYVGNNQFISSTTSSGVTIDSLTSGYWGSRYVGAKRVM